MPNIFSNASYAVGKRKKRKREKKIATPSTYYYYNSCISSNANTKIQPRMKDWCFGADYSYNKCMRMLNNNNYYYYYEYYGNK